MPSRAFAHNVTIERVEDAFVCQLERVVNNNHLLRLVDFCNGSTLVNEVVQILLPGFEKPLVFISPVAKSPNSVDVKRILSLANDCLPRLDLGVLDLLVDLA